MRVKEVGKRRVMWILFCWSISKRHKRHSCVFFCIDSEEEGTEKGEATGVLSHPEAPPEQILSSSNEREFCDLDCDEGVCLSPVSVVSSPVGGFL